MTDKTGYRFEDRPSDATPKPSVVDIAVEKPETRVEDERLTADTVDSVRMSVRRAIRYALATAGALIITTAGGSNTSTSQNYTLAQNGRPVSSEESVEVMAASNQKIDYIPAADTETRTPSAWQLFNMGHDNQTFNIDVKYPEPLTYRVEDLGDASNFKEITTIIEEEGKKVHAVIKLDKPAKEGIRYSVRLAGKPDQKPEGLNADGIAPLPKNPLE